MKRNRKRGITKDSSDLKVGEGDSQIVVVEGAFLIVAGEKVEVNLVEGEDSNAAVDSD